MGLIANLLNLAAATREAAGSQRVLGQGVRPRQTTTDAARELARAVNRKQAPELVNALKKELGID